MEKMYVVDKLAELKKKNLLLIYSFCIKNLYSTFTFSRTVLSTLIKAFSKWKHPSRLSDSLFLNNKCVIMLQEPTCWEDTKRLFSFFINISLPMVCIPFRFGLFFETVSFCRTALKSQSFCLQPKCWHVPPHTPWMKEASFLLSIIHPLNHTT